MKEEDFIRKHDTPANPFRTPEGYFEDFTSRLMERMEREGLVGQPSDVQPVRTEAKKVLMNPFRRFARYAAVAVVAALCIIGSTYILAPQRDDEHMLATDQLNFQFSDEAFDDVIDYAMEYEMVGNDQIAYYLTEAY